MTKTKNYQLNQWEAHDPVRRQDFNADNAAVDAALTSIRDSAAGEAAAAKQAAAAAQTTADTAIQNAAAAQSTANTAVQNAATAQTAANGAKTAAANAQTTANSAVSAAAAAQSTADAAAAAFVFGSYTGDGVSMDDGGQTISLGFRPRFVFITRGVLGTSGSYFIAVGEHPQTNQEWVYAATDDGFTVGHYGSGGIVAMNTAGYVYDYLAFR